MTDINAMSALEYKGGRLEQAKKGKYISENATLSSQSRSGEIKNMNWRCSYSSWIVLDN